MNVDDDHSIAHKAPNASASVSSTPTPTSNVGLPPCPSTTFTSSVSLPSPPVPSFDNESQMPPPSSTTTNKKDKRPRQVSEVWEHFTKIKEGDSQGPRSSCNYYGKTYATDIKKNGTSTLRHHLTVCKLYRNKFEDSSQKVLTFKGRKDGECANVPVFWLRYLIKKRVEPH